MKIKMKIGLLFFFLPTLTWAGVIRNGGSVGNGGGAWVCRESNQSIRWARLVDIFEGQNEFGLDIPFKSNMTADQQLEDIRQKIKNVNRNFYYAITKSLAEVKRKIKLVNVNLTVVDDALYRITPAQDSCVSGTIAYEQLANYTEFGMILVQTQLFNSITPTEQAGLLAHEAIYKLERERKNATNSVHTRKIVAELFSSVDPTQYAEDLEGYTTSYEDIACDICVELPAGERFSEGLAAFKRNGKYGYMDHNGKIVIEPRFSNANEFHEGLAAVSFPNNEKDGSPLWGFINTKGEIIYQPLSSIIPGDFSGGLAKVFGPMKSFGEKSLEGLIDRNGNYVVPLQANYIGKVSEGLFTIARADGKGCTYYNSKVEVVLKLDGFDHCFEFSEGLAAVYNKDGLGGYIDHNGKIAIPLSFANVGPFKEGLAVASPGGDVKGYINKSGVFVIQPEDRSAAWDIVHGMAIVKSRASNYFEILDLWGKKLTQQSFNWVGHYPAPKNESFELIPIQVGGRWGYIDLKGNMVIEPQFREADYFAEGLAATDKGYISLDLVRK